MKENYTHVSVIIDRSGSMSSMKNDVIGGFNTLVDEQIKNEGEATMTLVRFDHEYEVINDFVQISDVLKLDNNNFVPRGNTALLDAMGKTMNDVREKINRMPDNEKPSKAIFVFITDGGENASSEYNKDRVFEMIADLKRESEDQNNVKWDFVFIGANQDAIQAGGSYGIRANASLTFAANGEGATRAFSSLSKGLTSYRSAKCSSYSFSEEDRKAQVEVDNNCIPKYMTDLSNGTKS